MSTINGIIEAAFQPISQQTPNRIENSTECKSESPHQQSTQLEKANPNTQIMIEKSRGKKRGRSASRFDIMPDGHGRINKKRKINPVSSEIDPIQKSLLLILSEANMLKTNLEKQEKRNAEGKQRLLTENERLNKLNEKTLNGNKVLMEKAMMFQQENESLKKNVNTLKKVLSEKLNELQRVEGDKKKLTEHISSLEEAMKYNKIQFETKWNLHKKQFEVSVKEIEGEKNEILIKMEQTLDENKQLNLELMKWSKLRENIEIPLLETNASDCVINMNLFEECSESEISLDAMMGSEEVKLIKEDEVKHMKEMDELVMLWVDEIEETQHELESKKKALRKRDRLIQSMKNYRNEILFEFENERKKMRKEINEKENMITELRIENLGFKEDLKIRDVDDD